MSGGKLSGSAGENCVLHIDADTVHKNQGKTMPPLIAEVAPECADVPADSFVAINTVIFHGKGCKSAGRHSGNGAPARMSLSLGVHVRCRMRA